MRTLQERERKYEKIRTEQTATIKELTEERHKMEASLRATKEKLDKKKLAKSELKQTNRKLQAELDMAEERYQVFKHTFSF